MSSLIGKRLQGGKYKLETVLGRGGFGLTFRAHQLYLDQLVVIKTLNEDFWRAPNLSDLQRQFQDEARRLALCSHPNVVRVSDFFVEDQLPYMVMDYIPGRSLCDMVLPPNASPQPLRESVAITYVRQIGNALQAVHAKGLLHRDVKPQNIMIHQLTGEAVLIDFGIARELTQNPAKTHTSIVSEGYAPIEQYLPKAQRSAATDIYGLAATMYTLLTGVVPVAAVLRDRNPLIPLRQLRADVSPGVADAIARGMAIELRDRPQSVSRWLSSLSAGGYRETARETARKTNAPIGSSQRRPPTIQQKTGFWGRGKTVKGAANQGATPSELPTQVVAPAYYQSRPDAAASKTVAMPIPSAYQSERTGSVAAPVRPPKAKNKGCGCLSTLALTILFVAGIATAGGYWLVQQLSDGFPQLSLPDVLSDGGDDGVIEENPVQLPNEEPAETTEPSLEETETSEESAESENKPDKPEKGPPEETSPSTESAEDSVRGGLPPLLLSNSGNPANAQPGGNGNIVAVPGFAPGESAETIRSRLGSPSQENTVDGYSTSVYNVVPNRVRLGYVYEPGSAEVLQSEATFGGAVDRLVMRTTLLGMLDGRSTPAIEQGLDTVRSGEQDRYDFESRGFVGAIERNAYGHIHIYVQD